MNLPCKYKKQLLVKAMVEYFGLKEVDLDSPASVEKAISLILNFLDLDKYLQVQDAFGAPHTTATDRESDIHWYVRFTLSSLANQSIEQYKVAIKKFQDFIQSDKPETEIAIDKIKNIISNINRNNFELFIGLTSDQEGVIKVKLDLPQYWHFYTADYNTKTEEIYNYFIRCGLNSYDFNEYNNLKTSIFFFAKPE